ncbi:MAG: hypothetical protein GQ582_00300 [Methyloprofundus sp.]|nr:hypothetical protein [Methyloprofundus sp.]
MIKLCFKHRYLLLSSLIFITALILRLYNLDGTSLWKDEAVYANNSYGTFADFLARTRDNNSSPIFLPFIYWLLGDFAKNNFAVRFIPMLFGSVAVFVSLQFYRVGLSKKVTLIAAFWLAIAPVQIKYAQEVREYSLAVLISCLLIYGFLKSLKQRNLQGAYFFLAVLAFTPFASYGNIFLAGILLACLLLSDIGEQQFSWLKSLLLSAALLGATFISYLITAKYQMGIGKAYYLLYAYPPEECADLKKWLLKANTKYIKYALGGAIPATVAAVSMLLFSLLAFKNRYLKSPEAHLLVALILLWLASNTLAFLDLYPFWGMRQHLFAAPLIIIVTVASFVYLFSRLKYNIIYSLALVLLVIMPATYFKIKSVYAEVEDIQSPIIKIDQEATNDPVFIYYGSVAAINFHYPDRNFYLSQAKRKDLKTMYREIIALNSCRVYLVFSHMHRGEDKKLIKLLQKRGHRIVSIDKYRRARLVKLDTCA